MGRPREAQKWIDTIDDQDIKDSACSRIAVKIAEINQDEAQKWIDKMDNDMIKDDTNGLIAINLVEAGDFNGAVEYLEKMKARDSIIRTFFDFQSLLVNTGNMEELNWLKGEIEKRNMEEEWSYSSVIRGMLKIYLSQDIR